MEEKVHITNRCDRIGQQWGQYRIIDSLHEGRFSHSYLGEHCDDSTKQAVIDIFPVVLTSEECDHFLYQARSLSHLSHRHILPVLDAGTKERRPFFVFHYVKHISWRQLYHRGEQQSLEKFVPYARQIALALDYAHEQGFLHQNLCPEYVLLGWSHGVLLSDFSLACLEKQPQYLLALKEHHQVDLLPYRAPEQLQQSPCKASDQYALAAMAYEWLCGNPPFTGSADEVTHQHIHTPPIRLRERVSTLSREAEEIILQGLAKDPRQRFSSVTTFVNALERTYNMDVSVVPEAKKVYAFSNSSPRTPHPLPSGIILDEQLQAVPVSPLGKDHSSVSVPPSNPFFAATPLPESFLAKEAKLPLKGTDVAEPPFPSIATTGEREVDSVLPASKSVLAPLVAESALSVPQKASPRGLTTRRAFVVSAAALATVGGGGAWLLWRKLHPESSFLAPGNLLNKPQSTSVVTSDGVKLIYHGHQSRVNSIVWSPDGKRLASGGDDKLVLICDSTTGKTVMTYTGHQDRVNSVAWSPNGMYIASASADQTVQVWEANTGKQVFTYRGHNGSVNCVCWSPDSRLVASGGDDNLVQVWFALTGDVFFFGRAHTSGVLCVAWSPDSFRLASGSWDTKVRVYSTVRNDAFAVGDPVFSYSAHSAEVYSVAWSPDSQLLASGGGDKVLQLCNGTDGSSIKFPPRMHDAAIRSITWSPTGKRLASASDDGTVRIWEVPSGQISYTYAKHKASVFTTAWSPDDEKDIVSGGADQLVQVWQPR